MSLLDRLNQLAAKKQGNPLAAPQREKGKLLAVIQRAAADGNPNAWADVQRVCRVPVQFKLSDAELRDIHDRWVLAKAADNGFSLKEEQAAAVYAWEHYHGGFIKVGVGKGKTLASLLVAQAAYDMGYKKVLLMVPAHVFEQLSGIDIPWARTRIRLTLPIHRLGGVSAQKRMQIAASGRKGLYLLPYSCLSARNGHSVLWSIAPQLIIADECQSLTSTARSARGGRFKQFLREHLPRLVVLSGTITRKSVREYHILASAALQENSFLPLSFPLACEWGRVIDSDGYVDKTAHTGPLRMVIDWATAQFPDQRLPLDMSGFRKAFRMRMEHTPGVVSTGDEDLGVSLTVRNLPVDPERSNGAEELQRLISQVGEQWLTPNGDEIEHAIHTFKWLFELSAGFYNLLVWPEHEQLALRRGISFSEAEDLLERAKEHHALKQEYARQLRKWFGSHSRPGLDTPFLVGGDMARNGPKNVGVQLYSIWSEAKALEDPDFPERDSFPVRVCPYKVERAAEWAKQYAEEGCLIWYYHQEMGRWLVEELTDWGLNPCYCPAGKNTRILNSHGRITVASIKAHGTGKNLQHHGDQLIVQWPRGADAVEQAIGRTHRMGQQRDEVVVHTMQSLPWDHDNMAASLGDSLYIHQTMQPQKLMICTYDPIPLVTPWEVLKERGFQPHELSSVMRAALAERFTKSAD